MILMDPKLNPEGITFERYFNDPEVMMEIQCRFFEYSRTHLVRDVFMGINDKTVYHVYPDFQNTSEPEWFGCEIAYNGFNEPSTHKLKSVDLNKMIDPFGGFVAEKSREYVEYFKKREKEGYAWNGVPIKAPETYALWATDGPITVACSLIGATEFCIALYEDAEYAMALLEWITENTIRRMKARRKDFGLPELNDRMGFADDSIALLSTDDFVKFILPFHKRLKSELTEPDSKTYMHICGDVQRHLTTIRDEMDCVVFELGYPIDYGKIVREIGENVHIYGGVKSHTLLGDVGKIREETKKILDDVRPCRNFTMQEANNLSPCTPPENLLAMYETVKEFGVY
jgi:hypothetical protein